MLDGGIEPQEATGAKENVLQARTPVCREMWRVNELFNQKTKLAQRSTKARVSKRDIFHKPIEHDVVSEISRIRPSPLLLKVCNNTDSSDQIQYSPVRARSHSDQASTTWAGPGLRFRRASPGTTRNSCSVSADTLEAKTRISGRILTQ